MATSATTTNGGGGGGGGGEEHYESASVCYGSPALGGGGGGGGGGRHYQQNWPGGGGRATGETPPHPPNFAFLSFVLGFSNYSSVLLSNIFAVMSIACIATGSGYLNYDYNNDDPDTDLGEFCTYILRGQHDFPLLLTTNISPPNIQAGTATAPPPTCPRPETRTTAAADWPLRSTAAARTRRRGRGGRQGQTRYI